MPTELHSSSASPDGFAFAVSFFGLDTHQAELFWHCLPPRMKQHMRFYLEKVSNRHHWSESREESARRLYSVLEPCTIIHAIEEGVQNAIITRKDANNIEELFLTFVDADGEWKRI
jgi:hypothetical protein